MGVRVVRDGRPQEEEEEEEGGRKEKGSFFQTCDQIFLRYSEVKLGGK